MSPNWQDSLSDSEQLEIDVKDIYKVEDNPECAFKVIKQGKSYYWLRNKVIKHSPKALLKFYETKIIDKPNDLL